MDGHGTMAMTRDPMGCMGCRRKSAHLLQSMVPSGRTTAATMSCWTDLDCLTPQENSEDPRTISAPSSGSEEVSKWVDTLPG